MTSPQAGAPTRPVPTLFDFGSILPTFLHVFMELFYADVTGEMFVAPWVLIVVNHFLVVVCHRDPDHYYVTRVKL